MSNYDAWQVNKSDFPRGGDTKSKLAFLCKYGVLAPSVHNCQCWEFGISDNRITVSLVRERQLVAGDPTGRESWISLGACVENILIAGAFFGLDGEIAAKRNDSVTLEFRESKTEPKFEKLADAMVNRVSARGNFTERAVDPAVLGEINGVSIDGATAVATVDTGIMDTLADLTGRAISIALGNPDFRQELASLIRPNWTKLRTGMPGFTLGVSNARSAVESGLIGRGAIIKSQARKERSAMHHSAGAVLVFASGDSLPYWLAAGRAYQRANLIVTAAGLATSTTAACVEAADYHEDIERQAGVSTRLLTIARIGYTRSASRHSPRIPAEELITFSS